MPVTLKKNQNVPFKLGGHSKSCKHQTKDCRDLKYGTKVSTKQFRKVKCKLSPKFGSGVPVTLKNAEKWGSGMLQTFIRSPVKTKLKVIETSNMAQTNC